MQPIKTYMAKVDALVASRTPTKPNKKGLLAPSKPQQGGKEQQSDLTLIATYVAGIRSARQEMNNG